MTLEELNPGTKRTDGHAERKALGLKDTEATPIDLHGKPLTKEVVDAPTFGSAPWKPSPPKAK